MEPILPESGISAQSLPIEVCAAQVLSIGEEAGDEAQTDELIRQGVGSVNFFASALVDPAAAARRITALQGLAVRSPAGVPLLTGVDEEGGAVIRLPARRATMPSALAFGAIAAGSGLEAAAAMARGAARAIAGQLVAVGLNWDLAPVCDLAVADNPALGNRCFSADPRSAAVLAAAFVQGLTDGGVIAVAKHFPGHGASSVDSHRALPHLSVDRATLETREWVPFRAAIGAGVPMVMTGHLAVKAVDPSGTPASLSPLWTEILRDELGFGGVVVTDSLGMAGAQVRGGVAEAAVRALVAGADIVLVAHGPTEQRQTLEAIVWAVQEGRISPRRLREACGRVLALKAAFGLSRRPFPDEEGVAHLLRRPSDERLAAEVAGASITAIGGPKPIGGDGRGVVLVHTGPSDLLDACMQRWPGALRIEAGQEIPPGVEQAILVAYGRIAPGPTARERLVEARNRIVAAGIGVRWLWMGAPVRGFGSGAIPGWVATDGTPASLAALMRCASGEAPCRGGLVL